MIELVAVVMPTAVVAVVPTVVHHFGDFILRANLPAGWKVRDYVRNHHYIELEDAEGNVHHLRATDLVRGECCQCSFVFYVEIRYGAMICPHCRGDVDWIWGDAKLSFIAEAGSNFKSSAPPPLGPVEEPAGQDEVTDELEIPKPRVVHNGTDEEGDQ